MYFRSTILGIGAGIFCVSPSLGETDLTAALQAGANDQWTEAYTLVAGDMLKWDLVTWSRLRDGDAEFQDYVDFVEQYPDWPGMARLRRFGEASIARTDNPADIIAWFSSEPPLTGEGVLHYANALAQSGNATAAARVLGEAWLNLGMSEDAQNQIITIYGPVLQSLHMLRATNMIWQGNLGEAERMIPLLPQGDADLIAANLMLARAQTGARVALNDLPREQKLLPVSRYALFTWLMRRNEFTDAVKVLTRETSSAASLQNPINWADGRRILARWEMRQGRIESAYTLASRHYLSPEDGFVFHDLEWLSGYLSLTYLNNAEQALAHFERAATAVETPIATARVGYWIGRTQEVLGNAAAAADAYATAADIQTAFYGLLAAEKIGRSFDPALLGRGSYPDLSELDIADDPRVRSALALAEAGDRNGAFLFTTIVSDALTPQEFGALGNEFLRRNQPYYALLLGKNAAERGIILPDIYFPMHEMAAMELPVETELALAIARRESEFVVTAASPVGALGLMQLMPATAEEVSNDLGLEFATSRLTSDWEYNVTLGSQYLANLQEQFGNSPVMIAAGYNAGPSRPESWMDERGDPRLGEMDIVDWIEHIPFRETRNYVQRVTEAIPVYRAQLTGRADPVPFSQRLTGQKPIIRPQMRPFDLPSPTFEPELTPVEPQRPPTPEAETIDEVRAPQTVGPAPATTISAAPVAPVLEPLVEPQPTVTPEQFVVAETFPGDAAVAIIDFSFDSAIAPVEVTPSYDVIPSFTGTVWTSPRPVTRPDR